MEIHKFPYYDSWKNAVADFQEKTQGELVKREYLELFRPQFSWFAKSDLARNIHGIPHMTRVLVHVNNLAKVYRGEPLLGFKRDALSLSAVTHDTKRIIHNAVDPNHGERAAQWVKERFWNERQKNDGYVYTMSYWTVVYASYINHHHDPDDHTDTMSPLLALFKDADALDRFRDPHEGNFDTRYLRLPESHLFIPISQRLVQMSEMLIHEGGDPFDSVLTAASEMGLITQGSSIDHKTSDPQIVYEFQK